MNKNSQGRKSVHEKKYVPTTASLALIANMVQCEMAFPRFGLKEKFRNSNTYWRFRNLQGSNPGLHQFAQ